VRGDQTSQRLNTRADDSLTFPQESQPNVFWYIRKDDLTLLAFSPVMPRLFARWWMEYPNHVGLGMRNRHKSSNPCELSQIEPHLGSTLNAYALLSLISPSTGVPLPTPLWVLNRSDVLAWQAPRMWGGGEINSLVPSRAPTMPVKS